MTVSDTNTKIFFRSGLVDQVPGVVHGFGVRGVGLESYLAAAGFADCFFAVTNQVHGDRVHYLTQGLKTGVIEADSFITDSPGLVCFVRTADCVPILIADARLKVVAAVHAGWRGTALDIAGKTIFEMAKTFGTDPADCVAAIGPSICGKCYEVGPEVIDAFAELGVSGSWRIGKRNVDMAYMSCALLKRAGVPKGNIEVMPQCTFCDDTFASWRRDRDENERQFNFILGHLSKNSVCHP